MAVYVITWNINKERQNYDTARRAFIQHLEHYDNIKDSGLESVRWISTASTATQVYQDLMSKLDKNDRLFVSLMASGTHQGWLSQQTWNWIDAHI